MCELLSESTPIDDGRILKTKSVRFKRTLCILLVELLLIFDKHELAHDLK